MKEEEVKEYIETLNDLCRLDDPECCHYAADNILCEILEKLGYSNIVEAYSTIEKWYA